MKGTELHIMMKQLINNQGASFIADKRFANILLDMGCFDSCPKCKNVLKTINENDYTNRILAYVDGYEPKDDIFVTIFNELSSQYNYAKNDISYCIQCILYGLNVLNGIEKYSPNLDDSWLNQLEEYCSITQEELDAWNAEYFIFNVTPTNADVFVDGRRIKHDDEAIVVELACGEHHVKVSSPMYYNYEDSFIVSECQENSLSIELKPQFGSILIMTNAKDAIVFIDNVELGKAPVSMEKLSSGTHTLCITDDLHKKYEEVFVMNDGERLEKNIIMESNYGEVILCTDDKDLQVSIDGQYQGKGSWKGQLPVGHHCIECKKESHFTKIMDVFVKLGDESNNTFTLPVLDAYYGCLKVNVKPVGSSVYLDDELIGKTPLKYKNALTGKHIIKIVEPECGNKIEKDIKIEEGVITLVDEPMPQVFFNDYDKAEIGDYFYIDGTLSHKKTKDKKAVGVVFTLETTEEEKKHGWTHGQIIALENAGRCNWSSGIELPSYKYKSEKDKIKKEWNIIAKDKDGYKYSHLESVINNSHFEAFFMAEKYNKKVILPQSTSGWYLPTIGQFNDILENILKTKFHHIMLHLDVNIYGEMTDKLKLLNIKDNSFWTSSIFIFCNSNFAWTFGVSNYKNRIEAEGFMTSLCEREVRAVAAF